MKEIKIVKNVLKANQQIAEENRQTFKQHKMLVLNLMSSPGAGKTALIEKTLQHLKDKLSIAVLEGDIETTLDAQRIQQQGVPVVQLNTDGACHLEANMVRRGWQQFDQQQIDLLLIENVGNLVCPASYDLGEDYKVTICSLPEGADKPLKYPLMFNQSHVVLLNKIDLAPHLPQVSVEELRNNIGRVNSKAAIFPVSAVSEQGLSEWTGWLLNKVQEVKN